MQFMGDQPKPRGKDEIELVYELLKVSVVVCAGTWGRHRGLRMKSYPPWA